MMSTARSFRVSDRCSVNCRTTLSASIPTRNISAARDGAWESSQSTKTTSTTRRSPNLKDADLGRSTNVMGAITLEPRKLKFIDRIVADSRDVALNHTAGLSLPQQVMMSMFSLVELMDTEKRYQKACRDIVYRRLHALLGGLGTATAAEPQLRCLLWPDRFRVLGEEDIGPEAVEHLKEFVHPLDLAFRLAEDHGIVLLNGGGLRSSRLVATRVPG